VTTGKRHSKRLLKKRTREWEQVDEEIAEEDIIAEEAPNNEQEVDGGFILFAAALEKLMVQQRALAMQQVDMDDPFKFVADAACEIELIERFKRLTPTEMTSETVESIDISFEQVNWWFSVRKRLFGGIPVAAREAFAATILYLTGGLARFVSNKTAALYFMMPMMLLWKPYKDMSQLEVARLITTRCVRFMRGDFKWLMEAMVPAVKVFQIEQHGQRVEGFDMERLQRLVKNDYLSLATAHLIGADQKRLTVVSDEIRIMLTEKFSPLHGAEGLLISRQELLAELNVTGIKPFTIIKNGVKLGLEGKKGIPKKAAGGPSGFSSRHLLEALSVPISRDAIIGHLTKMVKQLARGSHSDEVAALFRHGKGTLLEHKTKDPMRTKVISAPDVLIKLYHKTMLRAIGKLGGQLPLLRTLFEDIQFAVGEANGVVIGPASICSALDRNKSDTTGIMSFDVKSFFPSGDKAFLLENLRLLCHKYPELSPVLYLFSDELSNNYIHLGDDGYIQTQYNGQAIGTTTASIFACLALQPILSQIKTEFKHELLDLKAYADNVNAATKLEHAIAIQERTRFLASAGGYQFPHFHFHMAFFEGTLQERHDLQAKFPTLTLSFAKPALDEPLGEEHGFLFRGGAMRVDPHGVVLEGFPIGSDNYICATTTLVVDRVLRAMRVLIDQHVELSVGMTIIQKCLLPSLQYHFSVVDPVVTKHLAEKADMEIDLLYAEYFQLALLPEQKVQWHLPRKKFGGFGLPSIANTAIAASIAMKLAIHSRIQIPLSPTFNDALSFLNLVVPVADKVPVSLDGLLSLQGKTQKDLSALINKASYSKLSSHLDEEDLIVLQTAGEPATALWMEPTYGAISSEDSGRVSSFLTDKEYRTLLRLRLVRLGGCHFLPAGISFPTGQHAVLCGKAAVSTGNVCAQKLDAGGVHSASCCSTQKYPRHNAVLAALTTAARSSGEGTSFHTILGEGIRGDVLLTTRIPNVMVDVTVRSPFVDGAMPMKNGKRDIYHHLNRAQAEKAGKYVPGAKAAGMLFYTFALSPVGMWGSETKTILAPMAAQYAESNFIAYSVATARIKRFIQVAQFKIMARHVYEGFERVESQLRNRAQRLQQSSD
jgi:hypothetical protein